MLNVLEAISKLKLKNSKNHFSILHCNKFPYNHGTFFRKIPICVSVVTSSVNIRKP